MGKTEEACDTLFQAARAVANGERKLTRTEADAIKKMLSIREWLEVCTHHRPDLYVEE